MAINMFLSFGKTTSEGVLGVARIPHVKKGTASSPTEIYLSATGWVRGFAIKTNSAATVQLFGCYEDPATNPNTPRTFICEWLITEPGLHNLKPATDVKEFPYFVVKKLSGDQIEAWLVSV